MLESFRLYWNTVRFLKPVQAFHQIGHRLSRGLPKTRSVPPLRPVPVGGVWVLGLEKPQSWLEENRFTFLNEARDLGGSIGWTDPACGRLWLYNLHYFDFLGQKNPPGGEWLDRWITENPPGVGVGWEPYPTSLRVVNWIKRHLAGAYLSAAQVESLALQVRWLRRNLEYHLLGNHLLANAKCLVFAGLFFDGPEAGEWLDKGQKLLKKELGEQILDDGGHFERSPMYHGIVLEDMLDLVNIVQMYGGLGEERELRSSLRRMLGWLSTMLHPDGDIPFFNDTTLGISPRCDRLTDYADRLGFDSKREVVRSSLLGFSGFARLSAGPCVLLADVGGIGPDYQPGHAHAEVLCFELSVNGKRCLVNPGISCYGESDDRVRQRGSAAHNCLIVDDENSSEVWRSHRVARRARVTGREFDPVAGRLVATHDGYRRLKGVGKHAREWVVGQDNVTVTDRVEGTGIHELRLHLHLHPRWDAVVDGRKIHISDGVDQIVLEGTDQLEWRVDSARYHPGFGLSETCRRVTGCGRLALPVTLRTIFTLIKVT